MKEMIIEYERELAKITRRAEELRALSHRYMPTDELNLLRKRLDVLISEKHELMSALAQMRKTVGPKPPHPSIIRSGSNALC